MDFASIRKLVDMAPMIARVGRINKELAALKASLEEEIQATPSQATSASINKLTTKVAILQKQKESSQPLDKEAALPTDEEFKQTVKKALPIIMQAIIASACDFVLNFESLPPQEQRLWRWDKTAQICRVAQVQSIQFEPGTEGGEMKYLILSQQPATLRPATWDNLYDSYWDGERTFWNEHISTLFWLPRRLKLGASLLGIAEAQQVYEAIGTLEAFAYMTSQSTKLSFEPLCADEEAVGGDLALDKESSSYFIVEEA
jgi:hypothetical protein